MVTERLDPIPAKTILLLGTSAGLDEAPLSTRLAASVSRSPTVKLIGPVELSCGMLWSEMFEIVGGSFRGVTVSVNVLVAVKARSLTTTEMLALPNLLAAGVNVTVRLAPPPPKTIALLGASVRLEELADSISPAA